MIRLILKSNEETRHLGRCLAKLLRAGDVILLTGDLGAGKTTLVKAVCSGLGMDERHVTSPTFAIIHEYRDARPPVCHADIYRLGPGADTRETGLQEYFNGDWAVMIEWSEYLHDAITDAIKIDMKWVDENVRDVLIEGTGESWGTRLPIMEQCLAEAHIVLSSRNAFAQNTVL
ncbi:MAG: tRNA (adenosine(37)-N6)-threonylcarbamoyltransferase complex ATPase subunit type 1 TsaE [Dissulfurimicrobium sp.]|uniref:tRNA (adenosine(37)-N6)-threonylcarbamoyltransferase complex ATPase subunit type 1 TsaE n=1 Tax=Dissulfurimicrobium sp. TaxID=2022436 RepID=UPI00404B9610